MRKRSEINIIMKLRENSVDLDMSTSRIFSLSRMASIIRNVEKVREPLHYAIQ